MSGVTTDTEAAAMDEVRSIRGGSASTGKGAGADPVTTEVIRHSIVAACDEMKLTLCRASVSAIIYDMWDFAAALFDRDVRLLGQSQGLPGFLGSLSFCIESSVAGVGGPEALKEGDILFNNYAADVGSHANDGALIAPIFHDGELVGYAVVKAHLVDVGAKEPYCTDTTDMYQEGTIFPGVKLVDGGEPNEDVWRIALANTRVPGELQADLNAEIACVRAGAAALVRIIERYGREEYERSIELMLDHGEAAARRFLAELPDGVYRGSGMLDGDGVSEGTVDFEVVVELRGGELAIDVTNASPTRPGPLNCPLPMTVSGARMAVLSLMGASEHVNDGYFRPVEIRVRSDTVFWPRPPAPMFLFGWPANTLIDVFHRAIATAAPERVGAGCGGDLGTLVWWGLREDGALWVAYNNIPQGSGAMHDRDGGGPLMHVNLSTVRPASFEIFEIRSGILPDRYELIPDTGGAGRFRGGNGVHARYEMLVAGSMTAVLERATLVPWGLEGGGDAARGTRVKLTYPDGSEDTRTKGTNIPMPPGTVLDLWSAGGGGYGPPAERDADAVLADVADGYVSEAAARRSYPHAFAGEGAERGA